VNSIIGGTFIWLFFVIWVAVLILPTIFFILTQQRALSKCAPANRTMSPGLVWLQIIPFFNFIWQFFVVIALANSLGAEFRMRGIQEEDKPGQGIGLAMCITRICVVIPLLGILSLIASVVLWIVYWVKIAGFSSKLDYAPGTSYPAPGYGQGYPGQPTVGGYPYQTGVQPPAYSAVPPAAAATAIAATAAPSAPVPAPAEIPAAETSSGPAPTVEAPAPEVPADAAPEVPADAAPEVPPTAAPESEGAVDTAGTES
jgi:hypothetical protein